MAVPRTAGPTVHDIRMPLLQGLFKKMAESGAGQPKRMTLESGPMAFHYILANNVAFLTLADKVSWWRQCIGGQNSSHCVQVPQCPS